MVVHKLRSVRREALRRAPWGLLLLALSGCARNEPFEVRLAELQERKLWRAGIENFAPDEYRDYLSRLRRAKDALLEAERKFVWFRDYDALAEQFKQIIARGDEIQSTIVERREKQKCGVAARLAEHRAKIERLDMLTTMISVGRAARFPLATATLLTDEAESLAERGRYAEAQAKLNRAVPHLQVAKNEIAPSLRRFVDQGQIAVWRRKVDETIRESAARGVYAIVVSKVDRKLYLYKAGRLVKTYDVGLGSRSINDKVYAGDRATPEGSYRITRKLTQSRYYRALLINYPNEEDRRQFALAKRRGAIPRRAGIGSLIEIHGGGKDGQTYGCVALDDHQMAELFALADVDTPVTIVGARDYENSLVQALRGL